MISDTPDNDSVERREVFALFGLSSYYAQCLERQTAIMLSTCYNREFPNATPDRRDSIYDEHFAQTFGALLRKLGKTTHVHPDLNQKLQEALKKRNWLTHHYFYDRATHILTSPGRTQMMAELTSLYKEFAELDKHLDSVMTRWCEKAGITQDKVEAEMSRMFDEEI